MPNNQKARPGVAAPGRAKDRQAFYGATPSTVQSTTRSPSGQFKIADFLGVGAENGLTNRQLQQLTGLDARTIQFRIQSERLHGAPILSDSVHGFFLPSSDEERSRCVRSLRRRSREIWRVADALAGIPGEGQTEIDDSQTE